jgi:hypothetical protein
MQVLELYEVTALSPDGSVVFGRRFDDVAPVDGRLHAA